MIICIFIYLGGPIVPRTATVLAFRDDGNGIPANATGQYICVAENCVGRTQRNLSVTVLGKILSPF